ncbi:MAG: hypothetical protein COB60_07340 [Flavobacteriaceae bacterium]|nr:MAG: hypothetical protein COB60_07340 [Flavobacteriaceae bacterium]
MKKLVYLFVLLSINSFGQEEKSETIIDLSAVEKSQYSSQNLLVKENNSGLEIYLKSGEEGSLTIYPSNKYWDLTQFVFLSLELENLTGKEVRFEPVILYDNPRRAEKFKKFKSVKNRHIGFLKPQENLVYNCVLIRDKINIQDYPQAPDFPIMKGLPNGVILNFDGVDAKHIKGLKIIFPTDNVDRKVLLKRVFKNRPALPELYVNDKKVFFPFINKYGQYKHGTWEGKITDDSQFEDAIEKENKELNKYPGSLEWNRFGGFMNGPKFEATGNFRTQKIEKKWWIIDPDGYLFWSTGVNGAGKLEVATPFKKREHFFEKIPKNNPDYKKFFKKNSYHFGLQNLYKKYGENAEEKYVPIALNRMKSWGFNTLGGWSNEDVALQPEKIKLPYTVYINATAPGINSKFPDVFDPKWEKDVAQKVKEKAAIVKDDPYFFGFFINNEIHWGTPFSLANQTLAKGQNTAGKKVFIELLKKELGSIENFNTNTGGNFNSWEALLQTKVKNNSLKLHNLKNINKKHYEHMVARYFKTTKNLINQYAPGKMYIGCRWHGNHKNKINVSIAAKYLDILTFNAYENEVEQYPYPPKEIDKPFIISEFNFGALDTGKFFTGLGYASNQRNRGEKYKNFIEGALRNPKCVGAHWFMWANSTTAGRGNGENANCGLVSMTDQIYYELISYMREINYKIYYNRLEE